MEYEQMRAMEKTHCCAMCNAPLVTIWDKENDCHRLCCGHDQTHDGFRRMLSPQKALQRGEANEVIGPGAQKDLEERAKRSQMIFSLLPKEDIATKRALGIAEIGGLTLFAEQLGLNALLGHVCLYHGKPYITVDGYYYLNSKRDKPFQIGVEPMTQEEKVAYMIEDATFAYIAQAWLDDRLLPETGCGYVVKDELEAKSRRDPEQWRAPVVHDHPQRMAEKRAEWQLLRKLIPLEVKGD